MALPRGAIRIIAAVAGVLLLCWASVLAVLGCVDSGLVASKAPTRRTRELQPEQPEEPFVEPDIARIIPDPSGSGKVDIVYEQPDGTETDSNPDGVQWEKEERFRDKMAEYRASARHHHFLPVLIALAIHVTFACVYKAKVVDWIPPLTQRPVSVDEDFRQDIFECTNSGQTHLCLHSTCCYQCRAAHTWHVAGLCEYWPALFLLFFLGCTKFACCIDSCVYAYFRMKLKEKLGIRRNVVMDVLYSMFCPCCAVGQEAMAVDAELGTDVQCCCQLSSPAVIGSVDPMERGNIVQLTNPSLNNDDMEAGE